MGLCNLLLRRVYASLVGWVALAFLKVRVELINILIHYYRDTATNSTPARRKFQMSTMDVLPMYSVVNCNYVKSAGLQVNYRCLLHNVSVSKA
jgi:hypothetical protein